MSVSVKAVEREIVLHVSPWWEVDLLALRELRRQLADEYGARLQLLASPFSSEVLMDLRGDWGG